MKFMFGLSTLSHANLEIKWEENMLLKKSFLRHLLLRLLSLRRYVSSIYMYATIVLVSDNGCTFTSAEFSAFSQ